MIRHAHAKFAPLGFINKKNEREMLSSLKVAKKYMHVYYFHGKHFTCWDLRGMLETDNFV